jgi:hypothetical protein
MVIAGIAVAALTVLALQAFLVLERGNLGLDSSNVHYLARHFARKSDIPRGLRVFERVSGQRRKGV